MYRARAKWLLLMLAVFGLSVGALGQQYGGVLRVALASNPLALDPQLVTVDDTTSIATHIFETLYAFDESILPQPMLVESDEYDMESNVLTMQLRQGVLFHNGKELDADDVVASLERWLAYGAQAGKLRPQVAGVAAVDKYTVTIQFTQFVSTAKGILATLWGGPVIMPKEIAEAAGSNRLTDAQAIGTGAYKFAERVPGQHLRLVRFDEYAALEGEAVGYGGRRTAYFDELRFITIPEAATRLAGVRAGDFDYAFGMAPDLFDQIDADPRTAVRVLSPPQSPWLAVNHNDGIMSNPLLYEAMYAALDMDEVMMLGAGPLGQALGSLMPEGSFWYTEAGTERYNQKDPELARDLLKQAGYQGEPIRFLTTPTHDYMYNLSMAVVNQLVQVGFRFQLLLYDWATLVSLRDNTDNWDLLIAAHGGVPDPTGWSLLIPTRYFRWGNPEIAELTSAFYAETSLDKQFEIWEKMQTLLYNDRIILKLGNRFQYDIVSTERVADVENWALPPIQIRDFHNIWQK